MSLRGGSRRVASKSRRSNLLIFLSILASCAPVHTSQPLPTITPTVFEPVPTPTSTPISATLTPAPPTITPAVAIIVTTGVCDPFAADFCITEGYFLLQRPVKPPANDSVDVTYPYGSTANGTRDPHRGVEFVNESGTPVFAAADGVVIFAGPDEEAVYSPWTNYYGNLVVIEHPQGLFTLYAHLSRIDVEAGNEVLAGQKIGEIGSTGAAIGSHLHLEVRRGDVQNYFSTQNPELWLLPKEDENGQLLGALMISIIDPAFEPRHAEITLDYHPERNQPKAKTYYVSTYARELMTSDENAALGDLPAGNYRMALDFNGGLYERWVEVESGKLTQVVIVVE